MRKRRNAVWKLAGVLLAGAMLLCGCEQEQKSTAEENVEERNDETASNETSIQEEQVKQALAVREPPRKVMEKKSLDGG